ncbi:hypothetical protein JCM10296v2_006136 [Rhodotorula toruloides]
MLLPVVCAHPDPYLSVRDLLKQRKGVWKLLLPQLPFLADLAIETDHSFAGWKCGILRNFFMHLGCSFRHVSTLDLSRVHSSVPRWDFDKPASYWQLGIIEDRNQVRLVLAFDSLGRDRQPLYREREITCPLEGLESRA